MQLKPTGKSGLELLVANRTQSENIKCCGGNEQLELLAIWMPNVLESHVAASCKVQNCMSEQMTVKSVRQPRSNVGSL